MSKPDYIIVGECRCGSSTLFEYLAKSPEIELPLPSDNFKYERSEYFLSQKELRFFDRHWNLGSDWYFSKFSFDKISGDCSATYLYDDTAMSRIKQLVPDTKIIILIRNPTDRAISHFYHLKNIGKIKMDFRSFMQKFGFDHDIFKRGIYLTQISKWAPEFKNVLLVKSEDLFNNDLDEICDFIGIAKYSNDFVKYRDSAKDLVDEDIIGMINGFYKPHNNLLSNLIV